jgi:hypothetical protein
LVSNGCTSRPNDVVGPAAAQAIATWPQSTVSPIAIRVGQHIGKRLTDEERFETGVILTRVSAGRTAVAESRRGGNAPPPGLPHGKDDAKRRAACRFVPHRCVKPAEFPQVSPVKLELRRDPGDDIF